MNKTTAFVCALFLSSAIASAQVGGGEVGLQLIRGNVGYGNVCSRQFSCSFVPVPLRRGDQIQLVVRGVLQQPYVIVLGASTQPLCLPIAGVHNKLMFPPLLFLAAGVLTQRDLIRACPGGVQPVGVQIPQSLPPGADLVFQALAWSYLSPRGQVPTLTMAIHAKVN